MEADRTAVVACQGQKARHVVLLALHLGVVQAGVALAAAPEHVVLATQLDGGIDRGLDLHRRTRHHIEVRVGRCAVHVARVREQVGGAPQQLDAGVGLALLGDADHVFEVALVLADVVGIRRQVDVVEAVIRHAKLGEEFKRGIGLGFGTVQRGVADIPRIRARARAERIGAIAAEAVPVGHGKAQMLGHGLVADLLVGVVDLEGQRVVRVAAFEADLADTGEIFFGADVDGVAHGVELLQRGEGRRKGVANQGPVTQRGDRACAPPPRQQRARSISAGDTYGGRA
ncbi:hypothetical protein CPBF367_38810 [Xanthomonas arboricola pv. juglandis]|nr:hypothetical protein CPBF367_38810 [Xanthomonas arboricola pv. juglandis]